jgi:hypothetical protein
MESNSQELDENMDKSQDLYMEGDDSFTKIVKNDHVYDGSIMRKRGTNEDFKEEMDKIGEGLTMTPIDVIDEYDKIIKKTDASNDQKGPVYKGVNKDGMRRLGPNGKKWVKIMVKHKIITED